MAVTQDDVIEAFLDRRNEILGTKYSVTSEPDKENRTGKAVDALCESEKASPLAIEHTRLLTFRDQIRDDHWFMRSVVPLEKLGTRYGDWHISIFFLYLRGMPWGDSVQVVERMRDWLDANIDQVPVTKTGRERFEGEIPGVGVVRISKHEDSKRPGIYVGRTVPTNIEFPGEAIEIMTDALGHKYDELSVYRTKGYISVLLIDVRDIALTNHIDQYKAFLRSTKVDARGGLEEIWLADIFEGAAVEDSVIDFLCFRGSKQIMDAANPENFMLGPEHQDYWNGVLATEDREGAR